MKVNANGSQFKYPSLLLEQKLESENFTSTRFSLLPKTLLPSGLNAIISLGLMPLGFLLGDLWSEHFTIGSREAPDILWQGQKLSWRSVSGPMGLSKNSALVSHMVFIFSFWFLELSLLKSLFT